MILISYDISDNKLRTRFSKYLRKFGHSIQYSVYEITNSQRLINNIMAEIEAKFKPKFTQKDSVMIFFVPDDTRIVRYGYAKNDEKDLIIVE